MHRLAPMLLDAGHEPTGLDGTEAFVESFLTEYGWVAGLVIVGFVFVQASAFLVGSLRRLYHQKSPPCIVGLNSDQ